MNKEIITGIILAGGKNSRMGTEKGLLPFNNSTFMKTIIDTLTPFCDEILINTNSNSYNELGHKIVKDNYLNCGPLAGLEAGLKASKNEKIIFLTCDSPSIRKEHIELLISESDHRKITYLSYKNNDYPLTAIYTKEALPIIENQIKKKELKVKEILNLTSSLKIEINEPILNINTKEDLELL